MRKRGAPDDDPTIIRHLYDLAALERHVTGTAEFEKLVQQIAEKDSGRGREAAPLDPAKRFTLMLDRLNTDKGWAADYETDHVLFAKITLCMENGKAAVARELLGGHGFGSTEFHVIRPQPHVMPEWVFYFVRRQSFRAEAKRNFTGTAGQQRVPTTFMAAAMLPVPPLEEQRRIVDILSQAEGIVRLRRKAQKKAAELIPILFLDMFGDPATNPKEWPETSVGDVIAAADYGSSTKASDNGSGVPLIRMGNVDFAGYLKLDDLKHVELSPEDIERFGLAEGDILFNRTNSKELVGKTGIWDGSREAVAASYFIRVRVARDKVNPFFFWAFMNSVHMKRVLFDTTRGAIGQSNINARELRAFPIMVPPLDQQDTYEYYCRDIFSISSSTSQCYAEG